MKLFLFLGLLSLSACVSGQNIPLNEDERIMVYGDFMSKTYQQKGEAIKVSGLQNNLVNIEKTKVPASKSRFWSYFVLPSSVAAAGVGISAIMDNNLSSAERDGRLGISLGLVGLALLSNYYSQNYLDEAVDKFNEKFPPLPIMEATPEPEDVDPDVEVEPSK